jgi:SpoVK/Ycf46/Vps4 family AAA+-type ATPase
MEQVKARLNAAFLAPMRNPELSALYAKSLRGGLMLYGPPGCGKTFIANALAGELGALDREEDQRQVIPVAQP